MLSCFWLSATARAHWPKSSTAHRYVRREKHLTYMSQECSRKSHQMYDWDGDICAMWIGVHSLSTRLRARTWAITSQSAGLSCRKRKRQPILSGGNSEFWFTLVVFIMMGDKDKERCDGLQDDCFDASFSPHYWCVRPSNCMIVIHGIANFICRQGVLLIHSFLRFSQTKDQVRFDLEMTEYLQTLPNTTAVPSMGKKVWLMGI